LTSLPTTALAAKRAYESAGISAEDVEVAEVHDCFTLTEILMMEALGFADAGKGGDMLVRGETDIEGSLPVNTGGGLVGFGHPVGATGVKQVIEIWRQMKGRCGDYQMPKLPSVGITANMGGDDKTAVVGLYRNL
jgi:acetyl-CoA acyltransferase